MKGFKRCEKGHMYKDNLSECPYCPKTGSSNSSNESKTEFAAGAKPSSDGNKFDKTEIFVDNQTKTETPKKPTPKATTPKAKPSESEDLNRTFIQGVTDTNDSSPKARSTRKLMGWIVTYSNDPMGIDFKIFEGRNFLGSNSKADITIGGDQSISGNHALVLCKKNKFWLRDEMSSNGTFLNNEELEPNESPELKDGDEIKLGSTTFKFKTSH